MKKHNTISSSFYQNLGKLFFAIAKADSTIKQEEYEHLKSIIAEKWFFLNHTFMENVSLVFEQLQKSDAKSSDCYNDFVAFKNDNLYLFTADIKLLILKTAGEIARSFSGINKSELILLAKLDLELKKNTTYGK